LENLVNWSNTWLLKFHPEKCKHMNIARVENRYTSDFTPSGKSLMNSMNNKGPNTETCGIPDVTSFQSDVDPLIDTLCVLPVRKSSIHPNNGLFNP
jgi:hypothetical protein